MKRTGSRLLMIFAALVFMSCAAKITQQPGVASVKKIAIISVYSNSTPYNLGGSGGALAAISSIASKKENKEGFGGTRLTEYALEMYSTDMMKISSWEILPPEELLAAPVYQAFCDSVKARRGSVLGTLSKVSRVTPPGMIDYIFTEGVSISGLVPKKRVEEISKLCNDLGIDAVATIELDIAYEKKGLLTGIASVSASINAVNSKGEWAVRTPDVREKDTKRFESNSKAGMVGGEMVFSDKVELMFQDAIQQNVTHHVQKIREELQ